MPSAYQKGLEYLVSALAPSDNTAHIPLADWVQQFFYVYDTEELLGLFPCQEEPLKLTMQKDEHGKYLYDTVLWSWMKKSAKSTVIAAVADYVAVTKPKASIKLIGNDVRQAQSRVGHYIKESIKIGADKGYPLSEYDEHMKHLRKQTRILGYTIEYPNGSIIEMIPIDPRGEAGGNDDMIVYSELWGWKHKSHQDMWAEMTISPNRYGYAQRWIDTYAGFEGESPILEQLYEEIVTNGNAIDIPENPECYVNQNGNMFATWVTVHHLPWQTKSYYDSERANLTEGQFNRLHLNQWDSSEDQFVPIAWYDDCADDNLPMITPYEPLIIALDAGVTDDSFAMVAIGRDQRVRFDPMHPDLHPSTFIRRYARCWYPPKNGRLSFYSNDPSVITPESELIRLIQNYNVVQVCYDPWQLEHFANTLEDKTGAWFEPFAQGSEREIGDKMLYDMIKERRFLHNGQKDALHEHISNANKKVNAHDNKLRIVKRNQDKKIDLAVAAAMGVKRAEDELVK